jgi:hypothetical protein
MKRLALSLLALALVAVACGDDDSGSDGPFPADAFAFAASSDLAVGTERLLVAVAGVNGERLPSPDVPVSLKVYPQDDPESAQAPPVRFMWAIEDVSGLYAATVEFDRAGIWLVEVTPEGGPTMEEFPITVLPEPTTVGVGEPAPQSDTPTAADGPLGQITSDPEPDPDLYRLSVAEAVSNGRPSVIAFATPAFCQTAICGPTLERIKEIAPAHPGVDFVHVEVYTNLDDPDNLEVVPSIIEWGLPTEPWIFVVGADGIVTHRFEGLVTAEELDAALASS